MREEESVRERKRDKMTGEGTGETAMTIRVRGTVRDSRLSTLEGDDERKSTTDASTTPPPSM